MPEEAQATAAPVTPAHLSRRLAQAPRSRLQTGTPTRLPSLCLPSVIPSLCNVLLAPQLNSLVRPALRAALWVLGLLALMGVVCLPNEQRAVWVCVAACGGSCLRDGRDSDSAWNGADEQAEDEEGSGV